MDTGIPVFRELPHECPYIPVRQCSNLRFELVQAAPEFMELLLERGFRHFGNHFFRPDCPDCRACVGIRVPVRTFRPNRSQRRCLRDNQDLILDAGPIVVDQERLDLLRRFQVARWMDKGWGLIEYDEAQYRSSFFWDSVISQELTVRDSSGRLLAVGIVDISSRSASATYHYHEPSEAHRGIGTWLILKELQLLAEMGLEYLYLGLWNGQCRSLDYKQRFQPYEMLEGFRWVPR